MKEENKSSKLAKMKENLQKVAKKRWVLPALYLGLGAIVLSLGMWLQSSDLGTEQDPSGNQGEVQDRNLSLDYEDALPVLKSTENFIMPVTNKDDVKVVGNFFDFEATEEEQQDALVFYDNTYFQNKGIDLAMENGETFDVVAALSGTVVKSEKDAIFGNVVNIEHDNKVVTVYQSLEGLKVEKGQTLKQGDVIGQAGRNLYNQDAGVHVHFEIRQGVTPVNPMAYLNQPVTSLPSPDLDQTDDKEDDTEDDTDDDTDDDTEDENDDQEESEENNN